YVFNDPINGTDPSGFEGEAAQAVWENAFGGYQYGGGEESVDAAEASSAGSGGPGLDSAGPAAMAGMMHQALSSTWPSFRGSPSVSVSGRPNAYSTGSSVTKGSGQGGRPGYAEA